MKPLSDQFSLLEIVILIISNYQGLPPRTQQDKQIQLLVEQLSVEPSQMDPLGSGANSRICGLTPSHY